MKLTLKQSKSHSQFIWNNYDTIMGVYVGMLIVPTSSSRWMIGTWKEQKCWIIWNNITLVVYMNVGLCLYCLYCILFTMLQCTWSAPLSALITKSAKNLYQNNNLLNCCVSDVISYKFKDFRCTISNSWALVSKPCTKPLVCALRLFNYAHMLVPIPHW